MPKLYMIDGITGAGKSTLLRALRDRGYAVVEEPIEKWQPILERAQAISNMDFSILTDTFSQFTREPECVFFLNGTSENRFLRAIHRERKGEDMLTLGYYASVPWFPGAVGLMTREPVEAENGRLTLNGVHLPAALVIQQDGVWWVRVKKSWLNHAIAHGRPFIAGKVGYRLRDNSVHEETIEDYTASRSLFETKAPVGEVGCLLVFQEHLPLK